MPIEYSVIGKHIRAARNRSHMTQEAVAEAIEMSAPHYGKVERGDRPINLKRLAQLCQLFNVPLEDLVAGAVMLEKTDTQSAANHYAESDFLDEMKNIAKGCTEDTLRLMARLCSEIAKEDHKRRFP